VYGATLATIWAIRRSAQVAWWMVPGVLVAAGVLPFLARRCLPPAVIRVQTIGQDLRVLAYSLVLLPLTYLAMHLLSWLDIAPPPVQATPSNYAAWAVYQFLYVAVTEEVFFRGYLLTSMLVWWRQPRSDGVLREGKSVGRKDGKQTRGGALQQSNGVSPLLPSSLPPLLPSRASWLAIAVSAACFALAHWVAQGQAAGLLTFLPGLVLGWLYARTGTLLAPILFHGLANVFWQFGMG